MKYGIPIYGWLVAMNETDKAFSLLKKYPTESNRQNGLVCSRRALRLTIYHMIGLGVPMLTAFALRFV